MVNYNMGRYYAWTNLSKLVKSTLRKYSSAPTYKFTYIPPKQSPLPIIVPFDEWKGNKEREKSTFSVSLLGIAFICFAAARWIYIALNDDYYGYFYQIKSPILCRAIELISLDLAEWTDPFFDIYPKNRYEINQIYPRIFELVFQRQKRITENDRKVMQLRKQIEEYDRKNK